MKRPILGAILALALILAGASVAQPASAQRSPIDSAVADAAQSAGLPKSWIEAVVRAESGGDPNAVSPAGAMGLMQLMPGTWHALSTRLALGPDPFDIRDNLLAGAHYLRDMLDRFGPSGFLAAYNAGPGRYAEHLAGRPLPAETRAYVARLSPHILGLATASAAAPAGTVRWTHSSLFPDAENEAEH